MSYLPLRLEPGSDLRRSLEETTPSFGPAFVVSGIGSLSGSRLRLAGSDSETALDGAFEILSLAGTLTPQGAHLHIAVADQGGRVIGGHVCYGNTVRTTVELLLVRVLDWELTREFDPGTGYKELVVTPQPNGAKNAA